MNYAAIIAAFVGGAATVLVALSMWNQPPSREQPLSGEQCRQLAASIKEETNELTALEPAITSSLVNYAVTYGMMASEERSQVQRAVQKADDIASDLQSKVREAISRCGLSADFLPPIDDGAEKIHKWHKAVKDDDALALRRLLNMN